MASSPAGSFARYVVMTQITGGRFHPHARDLVSGMREVIKLGGKWMQIDISVGTVVGAQTAANAPVFNDDFQRVAAADGADRASHHAKRIATLPAGSGHEIFIEAQTFANQTADALMGIGAGAHALIATCAFLEIEN